MDLMMLLRWWGINLGRRLYRVSLFFRRGLKILSRICIISCIVLHRRSLLGIGLGRFRRRLLGRVMENVENVGSVLVMLVEKVLIMVVDMDMVVLDRKLNQKVVILSDKYLSLISITKIRINNNNNSYNNHQSIHNQPKIPNKHNTHNDH